MEESESGWEPTASYTDFLQGIVAAYNHDVTPGEVPFKGTYWSFLRKNSVGPTGLFLILSVAVGLTLLRMILTRNFLMPIARKLQLSTNSQGKMCEAVWRMFFYSFSTSWALYSAYFRRPLFQKPSMLFSNVQPGAVVPIDIELLYALELGYYLHAIYTLFFLDTWKKDSSLMAFHHVLAMFLMTFSYCMDCTLSGVLIILLHDCCDIPLEIVKTLMSLQVQAGKFIPSIDRLTTICFSAFTFIWVFCRLYLYPLRVIHPCSLAIVEVKNKPPFSYHCYYMAIFLLVINVYWTLLIFRMIKNAIFGETSTIQDVREYDQEGHKDE